MKTYLLDARTVTPHFPGIGRYVANLAPAIAAQLEADERLIVLHAPEARARLAGLARPQVRLVESVISPFSVGQQLSIPRLLRRVEPDGGVNLYHSTYYLMPYSLRLPAVLTFYDLIPLQHPETVSRRARTLFQLTMSMALQTSAAVVSISEAARQDLLARFKLPPERVTTTQLAADARFRPQPPEEVARVRAKYALPARMLLYVGINKPHKNLVRLVEAFAQFQGTQIQVTQPDLSLVLAGPWDERYPEPKQAAEKLSLGERVRWLGPVDDADLAPLYAAADAFVFPSLYEGFGLPVLEAMACGTPVACSNTSCLPEIVGDAAVLFDPTDPAALAAALTQVADPAMRAERVAQGLAQAQRFSWPRTAALTLGVYRKIAR